MVSGYLTNVPKWQKRLMCQKKHKSRVGHNEILAVEADVTKLTINVKVRLGKSRSTLTKQTQD